MSLSEVARLLWRAIWFPSAPAAVRYKFPQSTAAARPGRRGLSGTGFSASAAVGRERGNPRSERSEPAALKVQLGEVRAGLPMRFQFQIEFEPSAGYHLGIGSFS